MPGRCECFIHFGDGYQLWISKTQKRVLGPSSVQEAVSGKNLRLLHFSDGGGGVSKTRVWPWPEPLMQNASAPWPGITNMCSSCFTLLSSSGCNRHSRHHQHPSFCRDVNTLALFLPANGFSLACDWYL